MAYTHSNFPATATLLPACQVSRTDLYGKSLNFIRKSTDLIGFLQTH
jgi:hypothetical protein